MRSAILLTIAGSAAAVPLGDAVNAVFARDPLVPPPEYLHGHPPPVAQTTTRTRVRPTGSFPTATGVFPTGTPPCSTGGYSILPHGPLPVPEQGDVFKTLSIKYNLAPNTPAASQAPEVYVEVNHRDSEKRDVDIPDHPRIRPRPPFQKPTHGYPTPTGGFPHPTGGPFPTGGYPTTIGTVITRPRPTGIFEMPRFPESPEETQDWWERVQNWFGRSGGWKGRGDHDDSQ